MVINRTQAMNVMDTTSGQVVTLVISNNFRKYTRSHTHGHCCNAALCANQINILIKIMLYTVCATLAHNYYRDLKRKKGVENAQFGYRARANMGIFPVFIHLFVFFFKLYDCMFVCDAKFKQVMQKWSLFFMHTTLTHTFFYFNHSSTQYSMHSIVFPLNLFVNKF